MEEIRLSTKTVNKPARRVAGVPALAEYLGLPDDVRLVRRWVDCGVFTGFKPGGRTGKVIFDLDDVDARMEELRRESPSAPASRRAIEAATPAVRRRKRGAAA